MISNFVVRSGLVMTLFTLLVGGCAHAPNTCAYRAPAGAPTLTLQEYQTRESLSSYRRSIKSAWKMIRCDTRNRNGYRLLGTAHHKIWLYYSRDSADLDKAAFAFSQYIQIAPDDWYPHAAMSEIYCGIGKHEKGLNALNTAIKLQPKRSSLYEFRAKILRKLDREEEAILDDKTVKTLQNREIPLH